MINAGNTGSTPASAYASSIIATALANSVRVDFSSSPIVSSWRQGYSSSESRLSLPTIDLKFFLALYLSNGEWNLWQSNILIQLANVFQSRSQFKCFSILTSMSLKSYWVNSSSMISASTSDVGILPSHSSILAVIQSDVRPTSAS